MEVLTRYARSGDLQIAYQTLGEGPLDVVVVPAFYSSIEIGWELPSLARFLEQLASFARVIQFDRRGAGMSGGVAGATPLEEQIDDVLAVIEAAGSEQPVLMSLNEGCALAVLFAASHPDLVRALALVTPTPRVVRGPGYEWAQTVEERATAVAAIVEHRGSSSPDQPPGPYAGADDQRRRFLARHQRLSMTPDDAAASLAMVGELDLEVRAGLHTGECELLSDDDIGGLAVHIGARISGLAAPGEVLVSSTVRDLIVGSGRTLADRGQHDLKGVPGRWRIFAVET